MEIPESNMELTDSAAPVPVVPETAAPSPEQSEKPAEAAPENPAPEAPQADADGLFELPDGRKVDAETLTKEWKENFLPEFTRKSQELAALRTPSEKKDITQPNNGEPKWKNPDYVPENYAEVIELATQEAERRQEAKARQATERTEQIRTQIEAEVASLKKIDPKLDENTLFAHANKYGFQDLTAAYTNMVDMRKVIVETEQRTVKNLKAREAEEVSSGSSGATTPDDGYDPGSMSQYQSANDFLARVRGNNR